jgi:antitoxin (DNA-binding transcriptional repressor) of toxin-antitoxin stability system
METKTFDVRKPQSKLQDLVAWIVKGTEVVLTEGDKPIARVVPFLSSTTPRVVGLHTGKIWTSADFDAPLPEGSWTGDNTSSK